MTDALSGPGVPSPARMYDCMLGGDAHQSCDRDAVAKVLEALPEAPLLARANRTFALAAVRYCAAQGIRQFIDVGTGIPTSPSVFETARACSPEAKVVGVDSDPVVLAEGAASVSSASSALIEGDVREPERLFGAPTLRRLIDLDEPVAVLLVAVLHFISDEEDPVAIVARIRQLLAPGSVLAVSHICATGSDPEAVRRIEGVYRQSSGAFHIRSEGGIRKLFGDLPLARPGHLVDVQRWGTDSPSAPTPVRIVAGVSAPIPP